MEKLVGLLGLHWQEFPESLRSNFWPRVMQGGGHQEPEVVPPVAVPVPVVPVWVAPAIQVITDVSKLLKLELSNNSSGASISAAALADCFRAARAADAAEILAFCSSDIGTPLLGGTLPF